MRDLAEHVGITMTFAEHDLGELALGADDRASARPRDDLRGEESPDWREALVVVGLHGGRPVDVPLLVGRPPRERDLLGY
jgi:hypothetical protein